MLAACSCEHSWKEATCTDPKTCTLCDTVDGEALGHNFIPATCIEPETCERCGATQGEPNGHKFGVSTCTEGAQCENCYEYDMPLGHDYVDGFCTRCGDVDQDFLVGQWVCDNSLKSYPDYMTLYSDGTGVADGTKINWYLDNSTNEFKLATFFKDYSYSYYISNGKLYFDGNEYYKVR